MANSEAKKAARRARQLELLKHFDEDSGYEEKRVGDQVYVKMWNGDAEVWQVAVFSMESFKRYKTYSKKPDKITYADRKANFEKAKKAQEAKGPKPKSDQKMEKVDIKDLLGGRRG